MATAACGTTTAITDTTTATVSHGFGTNGARRMVATSVRATAAIAPRYAYHRARSRHNVASRGQHTKVEELLVHETEHILG